MPEEYNKSNKELWNNLAMIQGLAVEVPENPSHHRTDSRADKNAKDHISPELSAGGPAAAGQQVIAVGFNSPFHASNFAHGRFSVQI